MEYCLPPHSSEAENAVLGAMMINAEIAHDIIDTLNEDDFYKPQNASIFTEIKALSKSNSAIDIITVSDRLQEAEVLQEIGGFNYIANLAADVTTTASTPHYIKIVKDKSILRKLIKTSQKIIEAAYDQKEETTEILNNAEKEILKINNQVPLEIPTINETVMSTIKGLELRCKNKGKISGTPTGFASIDMKLGGLEKADLIFIAGRPSMGKTSLAENIATYVGCIKKLPVVFFSQEMRKEKIIERMISGWAKIPNERMKMGTLNDKDWAEIVECSTQILESTLIIDDTPNAKASEMRAKCRRIKRQHGSLGLVVVDHLTEMWRPHRGNDRQEYEDNVREMKWLATEMDCPVILLQQLSRKVEERQDKRPIMSDLKETGAAEEVADVIMLIYRDEYYNKDTEKKNIAEVNIAKHRNGAPGTIELAWLGEYTKFAELPRGYYGE